MACPWVLPQAAAGAAAHSAAGKPATPMHLGSDSPITPITQFRSSLEQCVLCCDNAMAFMVRHIGYLREDVAESGVPAVRADAAARSI